MKYLVLLAFLSLNLACATSYEKCQKGDEWTRYGSMDSCVSMKEQDRAARGAAIKQAFDWKPAQMPQQSSSPSTAYCTTDLIGGTAYTYCH